MKLLALLTILAILGLAAASDLHCYTVSWDLRLHEVRCLRAEDDYGGSSPRPTATATPEIVLPPMEPTATPTEMPLPYPSPEPYP